MINAGEARLLNIVDTVVNHEDPADHAIRFLQKITEDRSLKIISYVMNSLWNARHLSADESMLEETKMFCDLAREESERRKKANH
jgi:enoyl-CoA hydratase/carnithine racemase